MAPPKGKSNNPKGRPRGIPNRATLYGEKHLATGGKLPRDYLLGVMRDERTPQAIRIQCAIAAAPYCHPKLATIDVRAYAALNTVTTHTTLDAMQLTPGQRQAVRSLLLAAADPAQAPAQDDVIEGDWSES